MDKLIPSLPSFNIGITANRLIGLLTTLLVVLQFQLWFSTSGYAQTRVLNQRLIAQEQANAKLDARNRLVMADIQDLKHGSAAIEERARYELGLVKPGETYYHFESD